LPTAQYRPERRLDDLCRSPLPSAAMELTYAKL
jgi:hypothetical protein